MAELDYTIAKDYDETVLAIVHVRKDQRFRAPLPCRPTVLVDLPLPRQLNAKWVLQHGAFGIVFRWATRTGV